MSAVAVVGMHRSGTSLAARLLHELGVWLGPEQELMPPGPDNVEGFWENLRVVELNTALLHALGTDWDCPMPVPDDLGPLVASHGDRAAALAGELGAHTPWAFKDPRTSLLLPFWRAVVPGLRVLLCVRNPLEVARSLERRNHNSTTHGLRLWRLYNERALAPTAPHERVVVHYEALLEDAGAELARIVPALALDAPVERVEAAAGRARRDLRHEAAAAADLSAAGVSPETVELYARLCAEAGREADAAAVRAGVDARELELARLRLDLREARSKADRAARTAAAERLDRLGDEVAALAARVDEMAAQVHDRLEGLAGALGAGDPEAARAAGAHARSVAAFRRAVRASVPAGARVLVVSRGDDALLDLGERRGEHFPRASDGGYVGYHPASGLAALAHLEALRYRPGGPGYLAIPQPQLWWLDHYESFARHLERRYALVGRTDAAAIWALDRSAAAGAGTWPGKLDDLLGAFAARFDRDPAVLDWGSGLGVAGRFSEVAVFSPPAAAGPELPYLDGTVDVVVVRAGDERRHAEARRVAVGAVALAQADDTLAVEWLDERSPALPSVSIVIPTYNRAELVEACVRSLIETVPPWLDADLLVVDDASGDDTGARLAALAAHEPRLRVLRNDRNLGFLLSANRGAAAARGEIVLALNNDTLALPGWLPPLLRVFRHHADAGAVGGKLIFPDGRLQEAGGVVFSDGRGANLGKWHVDPADPLFDHVREVDYVSGAHLALRRAFLEDVGGFDERYLPMYYEDADICFRVRQRGLRVYYQPESAIVHLEGGTAGTDEAESGKRHQRENRDRFVARWADALRRQPAYPSRFDLATLHRLAVREAVAP